MSTRKNTVLLKRSNVSGAVPIAGQLQLGELALNTADAKLYTSGTTKNSILQIGWDKVSKTGDTMTGTLSATSISATTFYGNGSNLTGISVSGSSSNILVTAGTFTNNTLVLTNSTGGTVTTPINNFTGLTINGIISATTMSATTYYGNGSNLNLGYVSFSQTSTGNVSGSTNEFTLISGGTGSLVIPTTKFIVGKSYRVNAGGVLSTAASNATTFTFRVKLGNNIIAATSALNVGTSVTNRAWQVQSSFVIRSIGTGGTVMASGMYSDSSSVVTNCDNGAVVTILDTTTGQTLNFTAQLSQTAAANRVSMTTFLLEETS
jgi:hypothetical protein